MEILHTTTASVLSAYLGRNAGETAINGGILFGVSDAIPTPEEVFAVR